MNFYGFQYHNKRYYNQYKSYPQRDEKSLIKLVMSTILKISKYYKITTYENKAEQISDNRHNCLCFSKSVDKKNEY